MSKSARFERAFEFGAVPGNGAFASRKPETEKGKIKNLQTVHKRKASIGSQKSRVLGSGLCFQDDYNGVISKPPHAKFRLLRAYL